MCMCIYIYIYIHVRGTGGKRRRRLGRRSRVYKLRMLPGNSLIFKSLALNRIYHCNPKSAFLKISLGKGAAPLLGAAAHSQFPRDCLFSGLGVSDFRVWEICVWDVRVEDSRYDSRTCLAWKGFTETKRCRSIGQQPGTKSASRPAVAHASMFPSK